MSTEDFWRPLGIDAEDDIAAYDALHDGIPSWMEASFWAWVREAITEWRKKPDGSGSVAHLNESLVEHLGRSLRIPLPNLRYRGTDLRAGRAQLTNALEYLEDYDGLAIADFILAHLQTNERQKLLLRNQLEELLRQSNSVWTIGTRSGKDGLVRRVPLGVQVGADAVISRSARAGVRLAKAWEAVYGLYPDASEAYRLAILAVEDAAIPVVSPKNSSATLGTVLRQMEDQGDWRLPMAREDDRAPSRDVLLRMMRLLWNGQHDRHGGQPSAPGDVSLHEATVAVAIATTLVQLFDAGAVVSRNRRQSGSGM